MNVIDYPVVSLKDIVAGLRRVADAIEKGDIGEFSTAFVVLPRNGDYPSVYGFGDVDGSNQPAVQLQLAVNFFLQNLVGRR